ncbi:VanZ family protein [Neptuniibacter caesariensis]|uniref:VanZ family protein n=1 Tax=Neptuniibacter caesariensis TaxID=207954 RepID=UPI0013899012|nr:hypothetical protein [Neptuniibacter caesariensis]
MNNSFTQKYKTIIWVIFLLALAALAYGIFRPAPPERIFENSDKVGHFMAFFGVSFMGRLALYKIPGWTYWSSWFVLAGLLEYLQGVLRPLRHFSIEDAYANAIGVLIAITVYIVATKISERAE